jgi:uncharacterized membrane protein
LKQVSKVFLKGFLAVLPLVVTIYLLVWTVEAFEGSVGALLRWILPKGWYVPGMGFVLGVAVILTVGVLLQAYFMRRLWKHLESRLERIPLVKFIYGSVRELVAYFDKDGAGSAARTVVSVRVGDDGSRFVGLVTRDSLAELGEGGEGLVAVYLPWSYQIGGFTVYVPRSRVTLLGMSVEEGLRFALTAGVVQGRGNGDVPVEDGVRAGA